MLLSHNEPNSLLPQIILVQLLKRLMPMNPNQLPQYSSRLSINAISLFVSSSSPLQNQLGIPYSIKHSKCLKLKLDRKELAITKEWKTENCHILTSSTQSFISKLLYALTQATIYCLNSSISDSSEYRLNSPNNLTSSSQIISNNNNIGIINEFVTYLLMNLFIHR